MGHHHRRTNAADKRQEAENNVIAIERREPHDEKTPEQTIAHVIREWENNSLDTTELSAAIIEALVYKAYFEEAEGALRWLDPVNLDGSEVLARIGVSA